MNKNTNFFIHYVLLIIYSIIHMYVRTCYLVLVCVHLFHYSCAR